VKWIGCVLAAIGCAWSQEIPRFSSDVQLVMVDVQVTEKGTGRILELLGPKDFELYDDNCRQEVRDFQFETPPLDVAFLLYGHSGWGPPKDINAFHQGLVAAVGALHPGDRAAIIRTDSGSKVDLAMTGDLTQARHVIIRGGKVRYRTGRDHLYDAVVAATTLFPRLRDPRRRRAIVAVTDDIERGSKAKIDSVITEVLEADATLNEAVVVLGVRGRRVGVGGVWGIPRVQREIGGTHGGESLRAAVEATGGEAIPGDEFKDRFPELINRIRMRYLLGFYPAPSTVREFHKLEVRLTPEAKTRYPNALIRARRGYYSEPATVSVQ
jgi:VWFA-related protein